MADAFQNPPPLANEYPSQAVHKFVVWFYDTFGPEGTSPLGGGNALAIPSGQTSMDLTYVSGGAADDDLIQTVTYQPSGAVMTVTYYGSTNNIQTVSIA
jgi:hypothetical protein